MSGKKGGRKKRAKIDREQIRELIKGMDADGGYINNLTYNDIFNAYHSPRGYGKPTDASLIKAIRDEVGGHIRASAREMERHHSSALPDLHLPPWATTAEQVLKPKKFEMREVLTLVEDYKTELKVNIERQDELANQLSILKNRQDELAERLLLLAEFLNSPDTITVCEWVNE